MLPLRYTSDSTVFIFQYNPVRNPEDVDTVYIVQENTPYFPVSYTHLYCSSYFHVLHDINELINNRRTKIDKKQ